jgi:hypothetical protein
MKRSALAAWLLTAFLIGRPAFAEFVFIDAPPAGGTVQASGVVDRAPAAVEVIPDPPVPCPAHGELEVIGTVPTQTVARGGPREVVRAVRGLIPAGWSVEHDDPPPVDVIWRHGAATDALREIARQADLCITLDAAMKLARIRTAPQARGQEAMRMAQTAPAARASQAPVDGALIAIDAEYIPAGPAPGLFDVRAGETVKAAFVRWAEASGWTVLWEADFDYAIQAPHTLAATSFTQAVEQVVRGFGRQATGRRLSARAYSGNQVLVISGRMN